ncbi:hypothetical protein [Candidatus Villigracilis affinis]|uniref:hypothetical protein n=1 Tax=Candidatus Villigracilis affinis TaxID=3140682 RepID=UPI001DB509CD|nr:hypothetical protein [Anaerolineales bacterium]
MCAPILRLLFAGYRCPNGGMPESSGSGGVNYIPNGGGSPSHPQVGDWQNLRLTLTLRPAGPMFVTLPLIGDLMLANGASQTIQWEVPSHPAWSDHPRRQCQWTG